MSKKKFYGFYDDLPKVYFEPDTKTTFVSQSEVQTSGLQYQLKQYGFDSLAQRMETMRAKFGYADCTQISDFAGLQNKYVNAVEYFNNLPSEVRRQYNDTPALFYDDIQKNPHTAFKAGFISEDFYNDLKVKYNMENSINNEVNPTSQSQPSKADPDSSLA